MGTLLPFGLTTLTSYPPASPNSTHPARLPSQGATERQDWAPGLLPLACLPCLWQVYDVFLPPEWCLAFGFYGEAGIS